MNYYEEIKETLIKNEVYKKVKDYSKNKKELNSYYEVGSLLVEAQGGEKRAKYGNKLIKQYSEKLTKELGKGYTPSNLKRMRQFYLIIQKGAPLRHQLSFTHYKNLLPFKDLEKTKYYIYITEAQNLSVRELRAKIKSKEYERIGYKEELNEPKVNTLIKDPIIIRVNKIPEKLTSELGKGYDVSNLKRMRQFYLTFPKGGTVSHLLEGLSWSHIYKILSVKNEDARNYYISIVKLQNLSVRELREKIKSKEYERIGYKE